MSLPLRLSDPIDQYNVFELQRESVHVSKPRFLADSRYSAVDLNHCKSSKYWYDFDAGLM